MSKIDDYLVEKAKAAALRTFAESIARKDCDKIGATVVISTTFRGYYGSSSVSAWPDEVIAAMEREVLAHLAYLASKSAERAEKIAEEHRKAAREEVAEVLLGTE